MDSCPEGSKPVIPQERELPKIPDLPAQSGAGKAKGKAKAKGKSAPTPAPTPVSTTTTTTSTTPPSQTGAGKAKGKEAKGKAKGKDVKAPVTPTPAQQPAAVEKREEPPPTPPRASSSTLDQRQAVVPLVELPGAPGVLMPISGLGMCCRPGANGPAATQAVMDFLAQGGRHIDTAIVYGNHREVGEGLRRSPNVPREDLFLVSKIPGDEFGFDRTWAAINRSLAELDVAFLDLLLLHWAGKHGKKAPDDPECVRETSDGLADWRLCRLGSWAALEQARRLGLVRAIGVSNFGPRHIQELLNAGGIRPSVNQIEFHPWYTNGDITEYCHQNSIVLTAYGSMGGSSMSGQIVSQEVIQKMGAQYGKTPGQVLLRWAVQSNVSVIAGTSNPSHMRENMEIFDFALSEEDMRLLNEAGSQQEMHVFGHRPETIV